MGNCLTQTKVKCLKATSSPKVAPILHAHFNKNVENPEDEEISHSSANQHGSGISSVEELGRIQLDSRLDDTFDKHDEAEMGSNTFRCMVCNKVIVRGEEGDQQSAHQKFLRHIEHECPFRANANRRGARQAPPPTNSSLNNSQTSSLYEDGFIWQKARVGKKNGSQTQKWIRKKSQMALHEIPLDQLQKLTPKKARLLLQSIEEKKAWFEHQLSQKRISYLEDSITMVVDRNRLVRDSYEQFRTIDGMDMHKEIKIHYVGEQAQDAGGVLRDWITDLSKAIFGVQNTDMEEGKPKSKWRVKSNQQIEQVYIDLDEGSCGIEGHMFKQVRCREELTYFPNPRRKSLYDLHYYRFAGLILAKAMFDKVPVNIKLHKVLLKRLVGRSHKIRIGDLRDFDEQIYKSLVYLATDPTVDVELLDMTFTLEAENGDILELIEGGSEVLVTKDNILDYVRCITRYQLIDHCRQEVREFMRGFYQVIPREILSVFDEDELDFLLEGVQEINLADWKQHTLYKGEYSIKHRVVKWFWELLGTYTQPQLRKLLLFATGMPRVPIDGFRALQSNRNRTCKFQLQSIKLEQPKYPQRCFIKAHTCFNRLDIPLYAKKGDLEYHLNVILMQDKFYFDME